MKAFKAALALACASVLLITAAPAFAQATDSSYDVKDGTGFHIRLAAKLFNLLLHPLHIFEGMTSSGTPVPVAVGSDGTIQVNCVAGCAAGSNTLGTQGTITAADAATTSTAGQSGVNAITGTPTAGSVVTYAVSGASGGTLTIGGTFSATAQIEASYDNGATYRASSALLRGTNITTATITGQGGFAVDLAAGTTNLRVRDTSYTSGTMTVNFTSSAAAGLTKILNGVKAVDSAGGDATDTTNHAVNVHVVAGATGGAPAIASAAPTATAAGSGKSLNTGLFSDLFVTTTDGAGNIVNPTAPVIVTTTQTGPTITTGGTWQTALSVSTTRKGCTIHNPVAATEELDVFFGSGTPPTTTFSLAPGGFLSCALANGYTAGDAVQVKAATTGHAFAMAVQ